MSHIHEDSAKELNRIDQVFVDLKKDYKENPNMYRAALIGFIFVAIVVSSFVTQWLNVLLHKQDYIAIVGLLSAWLSNIYSIIFTVIVYTFLIYSFHRTRTLFQKDYILIDDEGETYKMSKETTQGDMHWMTKKELVEGNHTDPDLPPDKFCVLNKDYYKHEGDILGITKDGYIVSRIMNIPGINDNTLVFGGSRSGKSDAVNLNKILQSIRRGESIITTDTKGDIFKDTAAIAKENGYLIRILNIKAKEIKNSDAWEVMKYITEEDDIQAEVLANAIILNTLEGERKDYWAKQELGALKGTLLLVATSPNYEGRRTFREVIDIIKHPSSFENKFAGLPSENPARIAFEIFAEADQRNRDQILNGLAQRMSLLNNKYVREIVSHDEIDLLLPVKRKCIYYVISADNDTSMQFISAMFFTQLFQVQCDFIDSLSKSNRKKCKRIHYCLDEHKAFGIIPDFDVKISTFASRGVYSTVTFQDIGQLKDMYQNNRYLDIIANSATKIATKLTDPDTAKFFSERCGFTTVINNQGRFEKRRTQLLDLHDNEYMNTSNIKRELLPVAKAQSLHRDRIIICIDGYMPIKLNKYLCSRVNPMFLAQTKEYSANKHVPKWRKQKELEKAKIEEQLSKMNTEDKMIHEATEDEKRYPAAKTKRPNMTILFENGDEVDPDTGEVLNNKPKTTAPKKHIPDIFDEEAEIKPPRKDIKKVSEVKSKRISRLETDLGATNGDDILDGLL